MVKTTDPERYRSLMDVWLSCAPFDAVPTRTMHDIIRLRIDVFVVEQQCPYPELDGRDADADTVHWWVTDADRIVATCRMLTGKTNGEYVLGRVATHPSVRGGPTATKLVDAALDSVSGPVTIGAQAPLEGWYARFGFVRSGPDYMEDGIPHLPMRLDR